MSVPKGIILSTSLILSLYCLWTYLYQILFMIIISITYISTISIVYEKHLGYKYPDEKKINIKLFGYHFKLPNEIGFKKEGIYYKFYKEQFGQFLYLYTIILFEVICVLSVFVAPSSLSLIFFVKSIFGGILMTSLSFIIIRPHYKYIDHLGFTQQ